MVRHQTRFSQANAAGGPQGYCFIIGLLPPVTFDRSHPWEVKAREKIQVFLKRSTFTLMYYKAGHTQKLFFSHAHALEVRKTPFIILIRTATAKYSKYD